MVYFGLRDNLLEANDQNVVKGVMSHTPGDTLQGTGLEAGPLMAESDRVLCGGFLSNDEVNLGVFPFVY